MEFGNEGRNESGRDLRAVERRSDACEFSCIHLYCTYSVRRIDLGIYCNNKEDYNIAF